jgi:hypothetical protein
MVTMCYGQSDLTIQVFLNTNVYIDPWLNTRLVDDLYSKNIEGHLLTINCEKLICKKKSFCINILSQVAALARVEDYFPLGGF